MDDITIQNFNWSVKLGMSLPFTAWLQTYGVEIIWLNKYVTHCCSSFAYSRSFCVNACQWLWLRVRWQFIQIAWIIVIYSNDFVHFKFSIGFWFFLSLSFSFNWIWAVPHTKKSECSIVNWFPLNHLQRSLGFSFSVFV